MLGLREPVGREDDLLQRLRVRGVARGRKHHGHGDREIREESVHSSVFPE